MPNPHFPSLLSSKVWAHHLGSTNQMHKPQTLNWHKAAESILVQHRWGRGLTQPHDLRHLSRVQPLSMVLSPLENPETPLPPINF